MDDLAITQIFQKNEQNGGGWGVAGYKGQTGQSGKQKGALAGIGSR